MKTDSERLLEKVSNLGGEGCWIWAGSKNATGYGGFRFRGQTKLVHRVAYELFVGDPSGLLVCHSCDTPLCVRPSHLFLGTVKDNSADMVAKGRHAGQRRTHCPKGHALEDTAYVWRGKRSCSVCMKAASRRHYERMVAANVVA